MLVHKLYRAASRVLVQPWHRLTRAVTLGVRVAAVTDDGRVLLIRHTYAPGWHLPGGGVESGETLAAAARRELTEEAGIVAEGPLRLHGMFSNDAVFRGDHIAVFIVDRFSRGDWRPGAEIAAAEFFPLAALPPDATPGTLRRAAEIAGGGIPSEVW